MQQGDCRGHRPGAAGPKRGGSPVFDLRRRDFITLLGGAVAAWPLAARAQQPALPVIGFLENRSPDAVVERLRAFRQGLKDTGHVEGANMAIEYRWADNQIYRLPALAAELVRREAITQMRAGSSIWPSSRSRIDQRWTNNEAGDKRDYGRDALKSPETRVSSGISNPSGRPIDLDEGLGRRQDCL
jgi:hypothetical protein